METIEAILACLGSGLIHQNGAYIVDIYTILKSPKQIDLQVTINFYCNSNLSVLRSSYLHRKGFVLHYMKTRDKQYFHAIKVHL